MATVVNGSYIYAQEDDGILTVAFADRSDQPTAYLILQRALSPTEQDKRLGHDRVHIELNEQSRSAYGGIKRVHLSGSQLLLSLDDKTASLLKSEQTVQVEINPGEREATNLRVQLNSLFAGQEGVAVESE